MEQERLCFVAFYQATDTFFFFKLQNTIVRWREVFKNVKPSGAEALCSSACRWREWAAPQARRQRSLIKLELAGA